MVCCNIILCDESNKISILSFEYFENITIFTNNISKLWSNTNGYNYLFIKLTYLILYHIFNYLS